jgi:hypothetical protein
MSMNSSHARTAPVDVAGSDDVGSENMEHFVDRHPALITLGRAGWIAKGIVYALVGVLAASIALGGSTGSSAGGEEASQQGAISRVADASFGAAALIAVAAGLLLYASWRLVTAALPARNDAHTWATRIGYVVSATVYLVLAWSAITYVLDPVGSSGGDTEDARVERFTRDVMSHIGGRWVVAIVGLAVIGVGGYFLVKALRAGFEDQLNGGGVGPLRHSHLVLLGRIGWTGRAVMMALIGYFLLQAAWRFDPGEATGLDGALRRAVESTVGTLLVMVVAAGLIVYGVYCVISAPRRRLAAADE